MYIDEADLIFFIAAALFILAAKEHQNETHKEHNAELIFYTENGTINSIWSVSMQKQCAGIERIRC